MLINELLLVLQQPAIYESFPLKLTESVIVFLMTYCEFEKMMKRPMAAVKKLSSHSWPI